ncbi:MAG: hypothetical protein ACI9TH_001495 [Kiritimatiellia bacterium]|jgi:hypothetical protein
MVCLLGIAVVFFGLLAGTSAAIRGSTLAASAASMTEAMLNHSMTPKAPTLGIVSTPLMAGNTSGWTLGMTK